MCSNGLACDVLMRIRPLHGLLEASCGHVLSQFNLEVDGCRYPSGSDL